MVTLNTQVRIQTRSGVTISTVSLNEFWAPLGNPTVFDPKVLYDPYGQRWIFTAMANARSTASALLLGVSRSTDPTGVWNLYRQDADPNRSTWIDYPSIGFNKDWIVVQANLFELAGNSFARADIYVFDKLNLYTHGIGKFSLFHELSGRSTLVPSLTYDSVGAAMYLVGSYNASAGQIVLKQVRGPLGLESISSEIVITSPEPWAFNAPAAEFLPQRGSTQKIDAGDARMQSCVFRSGSIWCVHTVFLPQDAPTRSAVQWWRFDPNGTVEQRGRIDDPTGARFYAYPSIAVNRNGAALIGFSRFSSSEYPHAAYALRGSADRANTFLRETVLKEGEAPYHKSLTKTRNRWGDYSATVVDPVNDTDLWTLQQYAAAPEAGDDRWGTWWGEIVPPTVRFSAEEYRKGEAETSAVLGVTRSGVGTTDSVAFETSDVTANDGADYTGIAGSLTFAPGELTRQVEVPLIDDLVAETDERFEVLLRSPSPGLSIEGQGVAAVSLADDEAPVVEYASSSFAVNENVGNALARVQRLGDVNVPVEVQYGTANGTALAGVDYLSVSGSVSFAAGDVQRTFLVPIVNNSLREAGKTIELNLTSDSGAALGERVSATMVIRASDQQPDVTVRLTGDPSSFGNGIYNLTASNQARATGISPGQKRVFLVHVQNDGNADNFFILRGSGSSAGFRVRYIVESTGTDITSLVVSGTYAGERYAPAASRALRLEITMGSSTAIGSAKSVLVTATWTGDGTKADRIRATVTA